MSILIGGSPGFIDSNFVFDWPAYLDKLLLNTEKLTYARHCDDLIGLAGDPAYLLVHSALINMQK
jgi:dTDP-glucose 4,6-dehydratase